MESAPWKKPPSVGVEPTTKEGKPLWKKKGLEKPRPPWRAFPMKTFGPKASVPKGPKELQVGLQSKENLVIWGW